MVNSKVRVRPNPNPTRPVKEILEEIISETDDQKTKKRLQDYLLDGINTEARANPSQERLIKQLDTKANNGQLVAMLALFNGFRG